MPGCIEFVDLRKRYHREWEKYLYSIGLSYSKMLKVIRRKDMLKKPPGVTL